MFLYYMLSIKWSIKRLLLNNILLLSFIPLVVWGQQVNIESPPNDTIIQSGQTINFIVGATEVKYVSGTIKFNNNTLQLFGTKDVSSGSGTFNITGWGINASATIQVASNTNNIISDSLLVDLQSTIYSTPTPTPTMTPTPGPTMLPETEIFPQDVSFGGRVAGRVINSTPVLVNFPSSSISIAGDIIYSSSVGLWYQYDTSNGWQILGKTGIISIVNETIISNNTIISGVTRGIFAKSSNIWKHNLTEGKKLNSLYSQALTIDGSPFNFSIFEVPRPYKPGQTLSVIVQRSGQWGAGTGFVGFLQTETVGDVILQSDPIATIINPIIETLTIGVLQ